MLLYSFLLSKILNKHIGIPLSRIIHPAHQWCLVSSWYPRAIHLFPCQRHFSSWLSGLGSENMNRFQILLGRRCGSCSSALWFVEWTLPCPGRLFCWFCGHVFSAAAAWNRTQGSLGLRASLWVSCFVSAQKQEGKKLRTQLRWGPLRCLGSKWTEALWTTGGLRARLAKVVKIMAGAGLVNGADGLFKSFGHKISFLRDFNSMLANCTGVSHFSFFHYNPIVQLLQPQL